MDTLEHYIAEVSVTNETHVDKKDPICILHTVLSKFETDLVTRQQEILQEFRSNVEAACNSIDDTEKHRLEKSLSYIRSCAVEMMNEIPNKTIQAVQREEFKRQLLECALQTMQDKMTVSVPSSLWIACMVSILLNVAVLVIFGLHVF